MWAGLYLDGEVVSEADLQPYVTDVLNELEFLTVMDTLNHFYMYECASNQSQGSTKTTYGALRASLGYRDPFTINYIEIGNEDYLNGGKASYSGNCHFFSSSLGSHICQITDSMLSITSCMPSTQQLLISPLFQSLHSQTRLQA